MSHAVAQKWGGLSFRPSARLLFGSLLIATIVVQWGMQLSAASDSAYLSYPYHWDQNRYHDYAYWFRHELTEGDSGLVSTFFRRPPYSPTLLVPVLALSTVTSIPVAVSINLTGYVLLLDFAAVVLCYRLTRSPLCCLTALWVLHFATLSFVSSTATDNILEAVKYQVNFPQCVLSVMVVAAIVEGASTSRPVPWSVILFASLVALFLLRPPAALFYGATLVVPAVGLLVYLRRAGRHRPFWYVLIGLTAALLVTAAYYGVIFTRLLDYFRQAQTDPQFQARSKTEWVLYYYWAARTHSYFFEVLVLVLVLFPAFRLPRLLLNRGTAQGGEPAGQGLFFLFVGSWVILSSAALLTLSPLKGRPFVLPLFCYVLLFGTAAGWKVVYDIRIRGRWHALLSPKAVKRLGTAWIAALACLAAGLVIRESGDTVAMARGERPDPFQARRALEKQILDRAISYALEWASANGRQRVTIGGGGQLDRIFDPHNVRLHRYVHGTVGGPTVRSTSPTSLDGSGPLLLFIPRLEPTELSELSRVLMRDFSQDAMDKIRAEAIKGGYTPLTNLTVTDSFRLQVLVRPGPEPDFQSFEFP